MSYRPRNILLTGGAGFIGRAVLEHLLSKYPEYAIVCLDKMDYCSSNLSDLIGRHSNLIVERGDILDENLVKKVFSLYNIETVMHFAAQSHVDNSFGNSLEFTRNNVLGTHVLLETSKKAQVKRFIHVSTDEVYGLCSDSSESATENNTMLEPTNPYAASKAGAEFLVKAYQRSFGLPVIITRGNNVYGPGQFPEKLIPKFISRLSRGLPCCLHGDGSQLRSFLFIDDVVCAFDRILHHGSVGSIYNIGTQEEISVKDVAHILMEKMNVHLPVETVADRNFNDMRYNISSSALGSLGWTPLVPFAQGVEKTIDWYRKTDLTRYFSYCSHIESHLTPHPDNKKL